MRVIGLTGGLGSGKSTVSQFLQELGAVILDADKVGHQTYLPDTPAWKDLVEAFGQEIVGADRVIDRKKLGPIVFSDPRKLEQLNGIVHPRMRELMERQIGEFKHQGVELVVLEAAILIEAKWLSLVDEVWVTQAAEEVVVTRVKARNNWSEEQIRERIASQLSSEERAKYAQVVIDTNGTLDEVKAQVGAYWDERVAARG
ncbi:MAG: dephospho-CoA kinase [Chloroflexi bacterium]|nr:dephospho-CoA kinase [Chloroflexota bacterium]MCI0769724.1 dephospho-CoA kinase [Chloroflexota bacterium]